MAITHKTVLITPKLAAEMLEKNTGNFRKPIPASIRKYGIALREGKWQFNGETIKIAIDGTVLDGQNRLYAIVETGISMPCIVVYGLPPERAMTMDTGKPRAIQDWIRHAGIKNANAVTAIGRMCCVYANGMWPLQGFQSSRISDDEIIKFIETHNSELQGAYSLAARCKTIIHGATLGSIMMVAVEFGNPEENHLCSWFCESLSKGVGLGASEPVLHLRNRLNVSSQHRENAYMQRMLACVAWNKTVRGETINKLLKFSMTGPNASRPIEVIELAPSNS